ncbi:glycerate kinase [Spea bombifrons]|uniref:glycerate kinase n=1 Tax=Spea bombifrons TaxID=233779 RepID=UPI00234A82B3|nr:glycerate kinase [Spea bombifrons]XP_053324905.1 glycerate kinase [Spea bombifrons]
MARVLRVLTRSLSSQTSKAKMGSLSLREDARKIFWGAVSAVLPPNMLQRSLKVREACGSLVLECGGVDFPLNKNLYLVGFGKAVLGMTAAVEQIVGNHILQGVISIPRGMEESLRVAGKREMLLSPGSPVRIMEGAEHNMADESALEAAREIHSLAKKLSEKDVLLVLISGGGSALLPAPMPPLTLHDKQTITKQLALRGATIQELNTLRRALSQLKGGGLARAAYPAQVISLILSDVIGDDLNVIASGPTVSSSYSTEGCLQILDKYDLRNSAPASVRDVLRSRSRTAAHDHFSHVHNILIGSNLIAMREAEQESARLGYHPSVLSSAISGDVRQVSRFYGLLARVICSMMMESSEQQQLQQEIIALGSEMAIPDLNLAEQLHEIAEYAGLGAVCVLCGGETTVLVQGEGKGGRNQELALRVAQEWHNFQGDLKGCEVLFLSGGTDGQDGPTEAAGAFSYPELLMDAKQGGFNVECFLNHSDSNTFFSQFHDGRYLLTTGLTGTNVMDVQVLLIRRKRDIQ